MASNQFWCSRQHAEKQSCVHPADFYVIPQRIEMRYAVFRIDDSRFNEVDVTAFPIQANQNLDIEVHSRTDIVFIQYGLRLIDWIRSEATHAVFNRQRQCFYPYPNMCRVAPVEPSFRNTVVIDRLA